jgi:hypothetical protein
MSPRICASVCRRWHSSTSLLRSTPCSHCGSSTTRSRHHRSRSSSSPGPRSLWAIHDAPHRRRGDRRTSTADHQLDTRLRDAGRDRCHGRRHRTRHAVGASRRRLWLRSGRNDLVISDARIQAAAPRATRATVTSVRGVGGGVVAGFAFLVIALRSEGDDPTRGLHRVIGLLALVSFLVWKWVPTSPFLLGTDVRFTSGVRRTSCPLHLGCQADISHRRAGRAHQIGGERIGHPQ